EDEDRRLARTSLDVDALGRVLEDRGGAHDGGDAGEGSGALDDELAARVDLLRELEGKGLGRGGVDGALGKDASPGERVRVRVDVGPRGDEAVGDERDPASAHEYGAHAEGVTPAGGERVEVEPLTAWTRDQGVAQVR